MSPTSRSHDGEVFATQVEFAPRSGDFGEEVGTFRLPLDLCIQRLRIQVEDHAIPGDEALLAWLVKLNEGEPGGCPSPIPEEFEDRARFVVADLWRSEGSEVMCRTCSRSVPCDVLSRVDWDDISDVEGMRVGAAGYKITCPGGHDLIFVCTRVF